MSASEGGLVPDDNDEPSAVPQTESSAAPSSPWEQRILQLDGKRYSLRLEHEFWAALEQIAERRRIRLNRLVADIAERCSPDANLSSVLRVHCLTELQRATAPRSVGTDRTSLLALAETAPTPCLVIDSDHAIIVANDAVLRWCGSTRETLMRGKATDQFRFQTDGDTSTLWTRLMSDGAAPEHAIVLNITPGRVLAADALLVPIASGRGRRLCLVWIRA